jgi:hypothetical protein
MKIHTVKAKKVKLYLCLINYHAMKTYEGAHVQLRMEMRSQLHAPAALPKGRSPGYPLDRRLSGPQSPSGRYRVEEKSLAPAWN